MLLIQETSINLFTVLQMNFDFWWFQIAKSLKFFFWKIHRIWCAEIRIKNDSIETFVLCIYLFYKSIVLYISSSFVMVFPMSKWQKMLVLFQKFGLNENWMLWKSNEKNTTRICCQLITWIITTFLSLSLRILLHYSHIFSANNNHRL